MHRYFIFILIIIAGSLFSATAKVKVSGVVIDSVSKAPVPYSSVMLKSAGWGKLTDASGRFFIESDNNTDSLIVKSMGYGTKIIPMRGSNQMKIYLSPDGVYLDEVVVKPKKERYSKKNNPAVDFVNRIRHSEHLTNPRRRPFYSFDKYQRITIALNNISSESNKNLILKKFDFLRDHIDTSEVSGRPILNISSREKRSRVYYRKDPRAEKEIVDGLSITGLDDFLDRESMQTLYEDLFSEIDLYADDIYLLRNKFISPLGKLAPDFYKFYLTDTVMIGDVSCVELTFVPHNSQTFGFAGRIYVDAGDSTMFIRRVEMGVPKDINLNFIESIYINQSFEKAADGTRLPVKDDLIAEVNVMSGLQGLYFRRNSSYSEHSFEASNQQDVYDIAGSSIIKDGAEERDSAYWSMHRTIPLRHGERSVGLMAKKMRSNKFYYWGEKILKVFALGYINTSTADSRFDIGPVNTFMSHDDVEGYRFRIGGMTTAHLSDRLFLRGYGAYGTKDHRWKYEAEAEWSFVKKKYHSREFPMHAIRLTHRYDLDRLGQHYMMTNPDNMFLSFKRHDDLLMTYLRSTRLEYILELRNGFSLNAGIVNSRQEQSPYVKFINGYGQTFGHYSQTGIDLMLRYAPGEKVYQGRSTRKSLTPQLPVVTLRHTYAPRKAFGNMFTLNLTELSYAQRFWLSAFGYVDVMLKGVHSWSAMPFTNLPLPNANLSYTIQPESFAMMNPMEFITDSYLMADITYWANGTFLNYVPFLKKLKLREVFSFRGFWGHLSDKNRPDINKSLFQFPEEASPIEKTPYAEASVGLDNIFKILRVDYVWRLTYLDKPGIDKGGIRIALHFTF